MIEEKLPNISVTKIPVNTKFKPQIEGGENFRTEVIRAFHNAVHYIIENAVCGMVFYLGVISVAFLVVLATIWISSLNGSLSELFKITWSIVTVWILIGTIFTMYKIGILLGRWVAKG